MSRRIFGTTFADGTSRCKLDGMTTEEKAEPKLLTVKTEHELLAEFYAAVEIFRGRSASDFVHNFMVQTIGLARKEVSKEEFKRLTALKFKEIQENSERRKKKPQKPASKSSNAKSPPQTNDKAA